MVYRTAPERAQTNVLVVRPERGPSSLVAMAVAAAGCVGFVALACRFTALVFVLVPTAVLLWWVGRLGVWAWFMRVEFTRRADGALHVVWLEPGARVERVVLLVDVVGVEVEASPIGTSQLVLVLTAKKRIVVATSTAVEGLGSLPAELRRFGR